MKMDCILKESYLVYLKMSSKYVPPAMRKKERHPAESSPPPPEKKYEDEFPSLTTAPAPYRVWRGPASFAEKANEWSVQAEKEAKELELLKKIDMEPTPQPSVRPLPRFHNIRRFVEEEPEEEETSKPASNEDESGWTRVERKTRKKRKSIGELVDEEIAKNATEGTDESVWNNDEKELHETCWEDRV